LEIEMPMEEYRKGNSFEHIEKQLLKGKCNKVLKNLYLLLSKKEEQIALMNVVL
tara:strand:- start:8 stop:169 length:162 start_codon:yes stop_codon:yes gene_type:complete